MDSGAPLYFQWNGEAMVPLRPKQADRQYTVGETYRLGVIEERSHNSHAHFFASLHEAYKNLPEAVSDRFPDEDHFRKHCLIDAGFYDERSFQCASRAEAVRLAAFLTPINSYARIVVHGSLVIERTAKSQSMRAMGKADFQRSKVAVLEIASALVGTSIATLEQNVGRAA